MRMTVGIKQVRRLRQMREQGKTLEQSAVAAAMSLRSAGKWQKGELPGQSDTPRNWRTRCDPFESIWESQILPLLEGPQGHQLQAKTIYGQLKWPEEEVLGKGSLRTLQRRIADWRTIVCGEKEVYFPQEKLAGDIAGFDFTCCNELGVTIRGAVFQHLFFEYVLTFSGWRSVTLSFSETYEALTFGLQNAFWECGGLVRRLRHDNLSAATRELGEPKRALTKRFGDFLTAFEITSMPINVGKSNENGSCEQSHFRFKAAMNQALVLRGSRDFPSQEQYVVFANQVVQSLNAACSTKFGIEQSALRACPAQRLPDYTKYESVVRKWSTIHFSSRTYSVPSRLIGKTVQVRLYPSKVEIWLRGTLVCTIPRIVGCARKRICYQHIIASLVRKPGAFENYIHRDEMFPTLVYRRVYDKLETDDARTAGVQYLRILKLASEHGESCVEMILATMLGCGESLDARIIQKMLETPPPAPPLMPEVRVDLDYYNIFLPTESTMAVMQ